jgi:hypothetical protein
MDSLRSLAQQQPKTRWTAFVTLGTGKRKNDQRRILLN